MSEIHGAVGSYVINALDPLELEEFEAHLAVCPTCTREVREFCETAAEFSLLAPQTAPPPMLRDSIMAAIGQVRPLPPPELETAPAELVPAPPEVAAAEPLDELAVRRLSRRSRFLSLAVAAALVVALALGGWGFSQARGRQEQIASAALETQLYTAPDVKIVATTTSNGAQVSFVSSRSLNKALFVANDLPPTEAGKRYQLWTLKGTQPLADNLLDGGTHHQWFSGPVAESTALAVTIEPAAGSAQPTTPAVASAPI
jgi:anti-sigma-K factor RskA